MCGKLYPLLFVCFSSQLKRVIEAIEKRGLNVGQLSLLIFRCCEKYTRSSHKGNEDFFSFVLKELSL